MRLASTNWLQCPEFAVNVIIEDRVNLGRPWVVRAAEAAEFFEDRVDLGRPWIVGAAEGAEFFLFCFFRPLPQFHPKKQCHEAFQTVNSYSKTKKKLIKQWSYW